MSVETRNLSARERYRNAHPSAGLRRSKFVTAEARFEFYTEPEPNTGCWLWVGLLDAYGYGVITHDGHQIKAHRYAFERFRGGLRDDLSIDHLCRVRCCVNPAHMEQVTRGENVLRGDGFAAINKRKTHCVHGHAYTPGNTATRHNGWRYCRTCWN